MLVCLPLRDLARPFSPSFSRCASFPQVGPISQMRGRPTDRPTADDRPWHSATIDEGERAGGGAERGTEDERVELKSTRGISPGHSRSSASLLRSRSFLPLTKVLLGSVFHFGFLPRGKSERASERRRRGLEMLYLNEPTPPPPLSSSPSTSGFRRRRFPQTVQQK